MRRFFSALLLVSIWALGAHAEKRLQVPLEDSPIRGPADAAVTMIEFIDFQ